MMRRVGLAVISALFLCFGTTLAHPPGADGQHDDHHHVDPAKIRTWTNAKTGEVVRGAFLAARTVDGVVRVSIERESGDVVVFPLVDLAEADRAEAQRRIDEVKATNERLAAARAVHRLYDPATKVQPAAGVQATATPTYTAAWVTPAVTAPRVSYHTFDSPAAGGKVSFHLYRPAAYDESASTPRRFPVVYWLHGSGGGLPGIALVASKFDAAINAGQMPPALVVFVNGLTEGMYVDWKDGSTPVESVIINALVPHIDATFRTVAARQGRVLDGFSMGGYGAARLGFKHHALFRAVSMMGAGPMQPELVQAPRAGRQRAAEVLAKTFGDQEYFKAVSPRRMAEENAAAIKAGSLVRMVCGDKDETFANNRAFHEHLAALGIAHEWKVLAGVAHDPAATFAALGDEMWAFYRAALTDGEAGSKHAAAGALWPEQAAPFNAFAPFVSTRWDDRWLFVESDGLPHAPAPPQAPGTQPEGAKKSYIFSHPMMVGITAWQQQVPLPQNYRGDNAWRIPLKPELAEKPVSAKEQLFRGAIALAANGVPIFNPIKNDGKTDTFLAGELDEFGGHCGRADDYHYHIAPTHLQKYVGAGQPIAYALDGFPIYGLFDPSAKPDGPDAEKCCPLGSHEPLDALNGHFGATTKGPGPDGTNTVAVRGLYHYHASVKYPYLNGGMRGVVTVKDDQIDPQPRATSPRAALPPLRGAKITGFKATGKEAEAAWSLEYLLGGKKHFVNYRLENAKWIFDFVDPLGATKTETYDATSPQRRQGGGGRPGEGGGGDRRPREDGAGGGNRPPRPPRDAAPQTAPEPASQPAATGFALSSADVTDGRLSIECTCDGKSRSPALSWGTPPEGTKAFAVVMHHITRDNDTHVYMVVANIPAAAREFKSGDASVGTWGQNTVNRTNAYAPPCSQGPGDKTYTITLYALSAEAKIPAGTPLTRDALLAAIKDNTLGTATLDVKHARAAK